MYKIFFYSLNKKLFFIKILLNFILLKEKIKKLNHQFSLIFLFFPKKNKIQYLNYKKEFLLKNYYISILLKKTKFKKILINFFKKKKINKLYYFFKNNIIFNISFIKNNKNFKYLKNNILFFLQQNSLLINYNNLDIIDYFITQNNDKIIKNITIDEIKKNNNFFIIEENTLDFNFLILNTIFINNLRLFFLKTNKKIYFFNKNIFYF